MSTVIPMYGWDTIHWKESSGKCLSSKNASTKPQDVAGEEVRMTNARLLRSRMKGNLHVRFCSQVMMATSWLRQREQGEGNREKGELRSVP